MVLAKVDFSEVLRRINVIVIMTASILFGIAMILCSIFLISQNYQMKYITLAKEVNLLADTNHRQSALIHSLINAVDTKHYQYDPKKEIVIPLKHKWFL